MKKVVRLATLVGWLWLAFLMAELLPSGFQLVASPTPARVEFYRDIRPILSDTCFACHGPDKANRTTVLRFDTEEGAMADLGGHRAIVPGEPARSEMIRRITTDDEAIRMPPSYSGRKLTSQQVDLLTRWVQQGAHWQKHWSLLPPKRPGLPSVADKVWPVTPIDFFILARLERQGLKPSPRADAATLIRRLSLDLTGLPPTPVEVKAFLADTSPGAYEKAVDRLLQSPRYGERMTLPWLEAARYADTNGYQTDGERTMWRWRDWVIAAFNRNMPFNQFTVEQIAGDLLPNATLDQKIATGFNRNHRGNGEGGIIPQEYAVEYVVDRVDTTATVWMGLTLGCARCHDHKYDPITQKEFYQVFAFFNNVTERGNAFKYGNSPPFIRTPTAEQVKELRALDYRLGLAESRFQKLAPQLAAAQAAWEASLDKTLPVHWGPSLDLVVHLPLGGSLKLNGSQPGRLLKGKFVDGAAEFAPGKAGLAASFDGRRFIELRREDEEIGGKLIPAEKPPVRTMDGADFGFYEKFSLCAWVLPDKQGGAILSRTKDVVEDTGYSLLLRDGKVQLNLVLRWLDDALRVETQDSLTPGRWHHVLATYDGSRLASGVQIVVDGQSEKLSVLLDTLNQPFRSPEPLRIGFGGGPAGRFHGLIDDVRIYERVLTGEEVAMLANPDSLTEIAGIAPAKRSPLQAAKMKAGFLDTSSPQSIRQTYSKLTDLRRRRAQLVDSFPTTMVMEEMSLPRNTFVLKRGAYDQPGEKVTAGVPASLPPLPASSRNDRLGFARWLVDPANPLTARVTVNRFWQMLFGTGLVKTAEDFGSQGESPTHPKLLDWLATEFVRTGWDVKAILKTLVMSETYRQSSRVSPDLLQRDPENRLLARGARFRLSAEMIRDQVLALSGLLVEKIGGPSVKPYQPDGLWKELSGGEDYRPDSGENLYRRSLYTFWKRAVAPPSMMNFDAAGREVCRVRETRTNTPLQALNLMNDVTFVEAARVLAQRLMSDANSTTEERLATGFRIAAARPPTPAEAHILLEGYQRHLAEFRRDPKAAVRLLGSGEAPVNEKLDVSELAASTLALSLILNLDEVITRE